MKLKGKVVTGIFSPGSKSEHEAVYLETEEGRHRLKRKGGNPFSDESLKAFIGKNIIAEGELNDYFFEITEDPEETE